MGERNLSFAHPAPRASHPQTPHPPTRWVLVALVVMGMVGCGRSPGPPPAIASSSRGLAPQRAGRSGQGASSPFRFTDVAREAGTDFLHVSGMTGDRHFPTANGSGVALFDYDGDGRLDLYFATCTLLPVGTARTGTNRLYKNMGDGTFRDATSASGLGFAGFCHGVVVGDIDNDGDADVLLANYGPNVLYLNNGDGKFTDISHSAGIDRPGWSSGGAVLDYDNDGDLDVFLANYGEWSVPGDDRFCGDVQKK